MKNNYFFRAPNNFLFLLLLTYMFSKCECECLTFTNNRVLIIYDHTDEEVFKEVKKNAPEHINKIKNKYFRCEACVGGSLKIVEIRDKCLNESLLSETYAPLPCDVQTDEVLPNDYTGFVKTIKTFGNSLKADSSVHKDLPNTCLYQPFCIELEDFMKEEDNQTNRLVIIYSDMLENHDQATSLYKHTFTPESFEEALKTRYNISIPELTGVHIQVINYSKGKSKEEENRIKFACDLWKEMLEKHGAEVSHLSSDLNLPKFNVTKKKSSE